MSELLKVKVYKALSALTSYSSCKKDSSTLIFCLSTKNSKSGRVRGTHHQKEGRSSIAGAKSMFSQSVM